MDAARTLLPETPLAALPQLPPRELKALQAAGLATVGEVLRVAPRRYEDRRRTATPRAT